ncbi:MAG: histidine kinase dimerization/phospho-acceptor domain-containing protein [Clostridium fessum]
MEFKTPLAAIEGYATLLQDPSLSEADRNEYTRIIIDSTRQLTTMTGNILLLSQPGKAGDRDWPHEVQPRRTNPSGDSSAGTALGEKASESRH